MHDRSGRLPAGISQPGAAFRVLRGLALAALLTPGGAGHGLAQSASPLGPAGEARPAQAAIAIGRPALRPSLGMSDGDRPEAASTIAVANDGSVMHRLPADAPRLRFTGETASHEYPIYLTGAQANARARIHLSYTNAVSVMPEASHMTISINDVVVVDAPISSSAANGTIVLDVEVPENILSPGYNAVRIAVQQRHRVDCSIGATYELWTQVDPANTGLAFTGIPQESIVDLVDLPALAPDPDGLRPIRLVIPKNTDTDGLDRTLRAMEAVVIRGNFGYPAIEIVQAPLDVPGLDIVVGTIDTLRQAGLSDLLTDDQPIAFRTGARSGQSTLVISGLGANEVEAAIADIQKGSIEGPPSGTVAGLRALTAAGTPIQGERTISFHDLGVTTQEFSGHLFRTGFDILMPPDFYAADYGKMTLRIDAGYVAGLDPSSQILVRVNDRDAASLALRNPNGDVFRNHPITVSLADLRPGYNHVDIEAQVSNPGDKACDVTSVIEAKKRFVLLDESTLEMPAVARIAHMPSLSATAASGFPYVNADADTHLFMPHPDAETIDAVATLLARAARAAGAPLAIKIVLSKPAIETTSALIVGAFDDLPASVGEAVGLDVRQTRDVWSNIEATDAGRRTPQPRPREGGRQSAGQAGGGRQRGRGAE